MGAKATQFEVVERFAPGNTGETSLLCVHVIKGSKLNRQLPITLNRIKAMPGFLRLA